MRSSWIPLITFNTIPLLGNGNISIYRNQIGGFSATLFTQGRKHCLKIRVLIFKHRTMDKSGTWTVLNITLTFIAYISVCGKVTTTRLAVKDFGFSQRCYWRFKSFGCDSDNVVERVVTDVWRVAGPSSSRVKQTWMAE